MMKSKANRLIEETSPYLLQHAYNPVDWFAWGDEALAKAKSVDKPILLSIGYAACHWCHVMEHESFEDPEIAEIMNEYFVPIKVDREERPDLDDIYMRSVQMMTGHGGWPMTVFLTPELKPFYGGTYFPPQDRHGMPSFRRVLLSVAKTWDEKREDVLLSSNEMATYLKQMTEVEKAGAKLSKEAMDAAVSRLLMIFDRQFGGFGGAPKFPQTSALSFILRKVKDNTELHDLLGLTLDKMAIGGIQDQIGGGFARYSVDRQWMVPHFEKMLYDNALLSRLYLEASLVYNGDSHRSDYYKDVGKNVLDFVLRELTSDEGAFYSSLDADSEGEEGKFYVFTHKEIEDILGKEDALFACQVYGITPFGNFEHQTTVLNLTDVPLKVASRANLGLGEFNKRLRQVNEKLLAYREKRIRPARDEKALTAWMSLMISGFVVGYRVIQDERYLNAAKKAAEFILNQLVKDGRLLRTWGKGKAKLNGYLDDYAYFTEALLDLASIDADPKWIQEAIRFADVMVTQFFDPNDGSFFYTSADHETLITRPKSFYDAPIPSASASCAFALLRLAKITDNESYRAKAESTISLYQPYFGKGSEQFSYFLCALDFCLATGAELVLSVKAKATESREAILAIGENYLPDTLVVVNDVNHGSNLPLLKDRPLILDKPTAYICRNFTCEKPINELADLKKALHAYSRS
jgi:uncharacterized protein